MRDSKEETSGSSSLYTRSPPPAPDNPSNRTAPSLYQYMGHQGMGRRSGEDPIRTLQGDMKDLIRELFIDGG